jgi:hypothetical protein
MEQYIQEQINFHISVDSLGDIMTWKDILKIDMKEARRLGEKYAPEDMVQGKLDRIERKKKIAQLQAEETLPKRRSKLKAIDDWLDRNDIPKDYEEAIGFSLDMAKKYLMDVDKYERYLNAIKHLMRGFPNNPFRRGSSKTSLIDRAKQANRDDPRMGSGRR